MAQTTNATEFIPFLDLAAQYRALRSELQVAVQAVFDRTNFVLGPEVDEFERAFAAYCGAKECVTVSNGTVAIHLALLAMGVGPGDEVITAANSFIATAEAISFVGATPCFVDVLEDTANIDWRSVEKAITPKTKVLLPVHLYGQPARMDHLRALADKHGIKLLEDACQAHGAVFQGRKTGTLGDAACFSFYPGKNLGAAGDGGAVVTNDSALADTMRLLRNHGSSKKYHHEIIGHNFRLDEVQAAVLNVKLKYLDEWNEKRRSHAAYYNQHLANIDGVELHSLEADTVSSCHLYVVKVPNRSAVEKAFQEQGIGFGIHYPVPIHLQPAYADHPAKAGDYPVSERLAESIISLPMFPELQRAQQDRIIQALAAAVGTTR